jgi:hypothetical protein
MRFVLGLLFGLLLGGLLAILLAAQMASAEPDDAEIFGLDDRAPTPPVPLQ